MNYKKLPISISPWALDSGGFTELSMYGMWKTTEREYISSVQRYVDEIGNLDFAAPMDWMVEPFMLNKTGLSIGDHQKRTVDNFVHLRDEAPHLPFIPVLQGWTRDDYLRCVDLYEEHGVDLWDGIVGVGTLCRRQATSEIELIVLELSKLKIKLHGFGIKTLGLNRYGYLLHSADSMAWSLRARYDLPIKGHKHKRCNNCLEYALRWREKVIEKTKVQQIHLF